MLGVDKINYIKHQMYSKSILTRILLIELVRVSKNRLRIETENEYCLYGLYPTSFS